MLYSKFARYFAKKENHKFDRDYESSLIYKNIMFKFINSYLAIAYTAYFSPQSNLKDVFNLLWPILIVD